MAEAYFYTARDLVEVVRCKDCKWFVFDKKSLLYICTSICGMNFPELNDYCSYGEKKHEID